MEALSPDIIPLRILVVDDNKDSARMLGWGIEMQGHEVRMAFNGPDAIQTAKDFLPHVIMLDIGLPDMNGYEICQVMRQAPELQNTLFLAQTGWEEDKTLTREAGFDHYLQKPVDFNQLTKLLNTAVRRAVN